MKTWSSVCVAVVLVLAVLASTAEALQCFHCSDCGDDVGSAIECGSSYTVCMKIDLAGRIDKTCGKKLACSLGSVERGAVSLWNNLKNMLSDVDEVSEEVDAKIMQCCDTDYCNSANTSLLHPLLLLLLPTFLYLFQQ